VYNKVLIFVSQGHSTIVVNNVVIIVVVGIY